MAFEADVDEWEKDNSNIIVAMTVHELRERVVASVWKSIVLQQEQEQEQEQDDADDATAETDEDDEDDEDDGYFGYMKENEVRCCVAKDYLSRCADVNARMREILINWLIEVAHKFQLRTETLCLTVSIIDRLLERRPQTSRYRLQLIGCTAMLLASKFEEIHPPEVEDFHYVSDDTVAHGDVLKMEYVILRALDFNLTTFTSYHFARRCLDRLGADVCGGFFFQVVYLCELVLQDSTMIGVLPSQIAAAAVYIAIRTSHLHTRAIANFKHVTGYDEDEIMPCVTQMCVVLHQSQPRYSSVRRLYAHASLKGVANSQWYNPTKE